MNPLVAIIGRPNVGKSSLFNRLVGARSAITHELAGTTRDANYGSVTWNGRAFMLVDTAGLEYAADGLDLAVQEQIMAVADVADLFIVVLDAATMITNEDRRAVELARKTGKPAILVINKIDTVKGQLGDEFARLGLHPIIETSAVHGRGSGDLLDAVAADVPKASPVAVTEDRVVSLALLGRPNVGKSTLFNSLAGKQQALTSTVPGTTRDVVSAEIKYKKQALRLLDTAGLRRRGKIQPGVEKFSALRTLSAIKQADVCVLVIDATELSVAGDQHIAGMAAEAGKGLILVVNKWDAVEKDERTQDRFTAKLMRDFAFVGWAPLVYTSATQGQNVTKLFELTSQIASRREHKIPTAQLNRTVGELVAAQPPAGLKNRQPKINYATQTDTNPPTFSFFGAYPEFIHFSYQRYLENGLRRAYDFTGTPIKIEFKGKK